MSNEENSQAQYRSRNRHNARSNHGRIVGCKLLGHEGTFTKSNTSTTSGQPGPVTMIQSGLAASAHLAGSQTQQQLLSNQSYWVYGGSAATHSSSYSISLATSQLL